ncbi:Glutamate receptor ionotropic, kainate 2-like 17, partial [Homarus americanus]
MMGLLDRGEADVGVASIYVSSHRTSVVDFTTPYDSRWHALTYPFTALTWISILVGFLVAGPVLYLLARASDIWGGGESSDLQEFGYSWLYSFGVHMKVAQDQLPIARSTQVLVTFLWIYTIILTLGYSTNLTAYLIVAKAPTSINTISELRQSGVEVAGLGEFYKYALASAIDQDLQSLTKTYRAHQSVETIFPRVLEGRSVFLQNRAFIEFVRLSRFTRRGESTIRIMKECFAPYSIAMAVQRHSPFKRKFDKVIGWLQQAGLMRQLFLNSLRLAASTEV